MKLESDKRVVCDGSCSECPRCLRLYICDAVDCGAWRTWLGSRIALTFNILTFKACSVCVYLLRIAVRFKSSQVCWSAPFDLALLWQIAPTTATATMSDETRRSDCMGPSLRPRLCSTPHERSVLNELYQPRFCLLQCRSNVHVSSINTNGCYKSLLLTLFFCFCTVNLELSTSTSNVESVYRANAL